MQHTKNPPIPQPTGNVVTDPKLGYALDSAALICALVVIVELNVAPTALIGEVFGLAIAEHMPAALLAANGLAFGWSSLRFSQPHGNTTQVFMRFMGVFCLILAAARWAGI